MISNSFEKWRRVVDAHGCSLLLAFAVVAVVAVVVVVVVVVADYDDYVLVPGPLQSLPFLLLVITVDDNRYRFKSKPQSLKMLCCGGTPFCDNSTFLTQIRRQF